MHLSNCFKKNFSLTPTRLIFENGPEKSSEATKQKVEANKDPVNKLDANEATEVLKDPKKLDELCNEAFLYNYKGDDYNSALDVARILISKICNDQAKLKAVANSRLNPANLNDDYTLASVLKYMQQPDAYFIKIYENPKIESDDVKEEALKKVQDLDYKVQKIKAGLTELSNAVDVIDKSARHANLSRAYYSARECIRSIKDKDSLEDLLGTSLAINVKSETAEKEKIRLIEIIEDQMKR